MTDAELLEDIEAQKALMMAVATGGPRIESVNGEYIQSRQRIATELAQRRIDDPNPYTDLWRWYGKWSSGDLPTYRSRRTYIGELYAPLIERLQRGGVAVGSDLFEAPTGWTKVDRQIDGIRTAWGIAAARPSSRSRRPSIGRACIARRTGPTRAPRTRSA
jgi:hypothetical protein